MGLVSIEFDTIYWYYEYLTSDYTFQDTGMYSSCKVCKSFCIPTLHTFPDNINYALYFLAEALSEVQLAVAFV